MNKIKSKLLLVCTLMIILAVGTFFLFYTPKTSCTTSHNPSGESVQMCPEPGQSPYQKIYLKMHAYLYPNDTCMISIETGKANCQPFLLPTCNQSATTTPCSVLENMRLNPPQQPVAVSTPMSEWETFENTKYGYSVLVPKTAFIRDVTYIPDIHKASELAFSAEGGGFDIKIIDVSLWLKNEETEKRDIFEKVKKLLSLDLKSFAEAIRDWDVNYVIPHITDTKGDLMEVEFAGAKAYKMVFGDTNRLMVTGGSLQKFSHAYIITENLGGQKVVIDYFLNDTTEKMVQSLKFTK